jgi:hypothetical protein
MCVKQSLAFRLLRVLKAAASSAALQKMKTSKNIFQALCVGVWPLRWISSVTIYRIDK